MTEEVHELKRLNNTWLIMFADLAALMLTFFVLLFSMSQIADSDWRAVKEALGASLDPQRTTAGPNTAPGSASRNLSFPEPPTSTTFTP